MPNNQQPNQEREQRQAKPGRQDDQRQDQDMRPERDQERGGKKDKRH